MTSVGNSLVTILVAIVMLAIVSVLLSKRSDTVSVLDSGGNFFSSLVNKAVNI